MITNLAHVCFVVRDLEAAMAFYRDGLGLTPAFDFTNAQGVKYGAYLHIGGRSFIELFQGEPTPPAAQQSFRHICLEVDDIQATVTALQARGIAVGEITLGSDQSWQAWLKDPDGNDIELHQYTAQSWQYGPWMPA